MNRFAVFFGVALVVLCGTSEGQLKADAPIVIAHRGASGYLPEHTIPAVVMAHTQGADYIEQDVVLTRDGIPIVLHDIHLDRVTDVATRFPGRQRDDGRFYAIDFLWEEIQQLTVTERTTADSKAIFPNRFPVHTGPFRVPSLAEELAVIGGLNHSTGRFAGIYPEIKQPAFHREQGQDISRIVMNLLGEHGYRTKQDRVYLQCFDLAETRRLREELGCQLKLIQLLSGESWKATAAEATLKRQLATIAEYADGVGPSIPDLLVVTPEGHVTVSPLISLAQAQGLLVHPWTARADDLPPHIESFTQLHQLLSTAKVDGCFSDFPDQTKTLFSAPRSE